MTLASGSAAVTSTSTGSCLDFNVVSDLLYLVEARGLHRRPVNHGMSTREPWHWHLPLAVHLRVTPQARWPPGAADV